MGSEVVRAADAAQYVRESIPEADRGRIKVRLLNVTPDPLGSVAALIAQYSGKVIRNLSEVTDEMRKAALADMGKTVLNGPLEAVQFHWQIEGVTRSITHQMVRSRASFFAQESLRFAVPEGNWADEIPVPPSLAGKPEEDPAVHTWRNAMIDAQESYAKLIEWGVPAEEARGVLPHDMPTRLHVVHDLRTLLAEAGKRTCTQAQFPWRMIFAGMANALRQYGSEAGNYRRQVQDGWQYNAIADALRPVCFQTGSCGFMAEFDRSCSIRQRVETLGSAGLGMPSTDWKSPQKINAFVAEQTGSPVDPSMGQELSINDFEWAANPAAARS